MITAYAITFGGFLMLGGRAADLLGRRRVFVVGVVVFTIASFFCGLAWSEAVLIVSRAVQGLGAAIISPRRRSRSSSPRSTKAPSATRHSGSGVRSAAAAQRSACWRAVC